MNKIIENIKENMPYFINEEDSFEIIIGKILSKLKDNGINLEVNDYEVVDFKESFSKVNFKILIQHLEEKKEEIITLIVINNDFYEQVIKLFKRSIEIYLIKTFKIDKTPINEKESITDKQKSFLEDKMKYNSQIIEKELDKMQVSSIKELSKAQASQIITSLQRNKYRNKEF